ncbi:MAG: phage terminase large subunit family protein [Clostridia bacterium]|nr:phage terminase large subunit family protein [Clostridia bacterium]
MKDKKGSICTNVEYKEQGQKINALGVENSDYTETDRNLEVIDIKQEARSRNPISQQEEPRSAGENKEDSELENQAVPCPYCGIKTESKLEEDNTHYICEVCGQKFINATIIKQDKEENVKEWQNKHKLEIGENGEVQFEANDGILILQKENIRKINSDICSQIKTLIISYGVVRFKNKFWQQMTCLEKIVFQSNDEGEFSYKKSKIKHNNTSIKIYGKTKFGKEITIKYAGADKKNKNGLTFLKELFIKIRELFKPRNNKSEDNKSESKSNEENSADKTIKLDPDSVINITDRLYTVLKYEIADINNKIEDVEASIEKSTKEMSDKLTIIDKLIKQNKQLSYQLEYYKKLFAKAILGEEYSEQQYNNLKKEFNCAMYGFGALCDIKKIYFDIKKRQDGKLSIDYEIKELNKVLEEYERMIGENLK